MDPDELSPENAFANAIEKIKYPHTRDEGMEMLIKEVEVYHNTDYVLTHQVSIAKIFAIFLITENDEITTEFVRILGILAIGGFRTKTPGLVDKLMKIAETEINSEDLRETSIMTVATFRMFLDIGLEDKNNIKQWLKQLSRLQTLPINIGKTAHIAYMSTLNFNEYLLSFGATEAILPKKNSIHDDHLEGSRQVLKFILGPNGYEEHWFFNKGVKSVLNHIETESVNKEEDDFVILEEQDNQECAVNSLGFVLM